MSVEDLSSDINGYNQVNRCVLAPNYNIKSKSTTWRRSVISLDAGFAQTVFQCRQKKNNKHYTTEQTSAVGKQDRQARRFTASYTYNNVFKTIKHHFPCVVCVDKKKSKIQNNRVKPSSLVFLSQSSCPVTTRRRPTTPAQEASTGWTAFPHDPQTLPTPRRRPPEAGWRRRWRAPESSSRRRSWAPSSSKTSARRSRYRGEPGWRIRWCQTVFSLLS